jgi:bacillithiol system protein YtxJ
MEWKLLSSEAELDEIIKKSATKSQVIFKHSTRCSISAVAKGRLDRSEAPEDVDFYYLDLIRFRNVSNRIADIFMVEHESPQILVIRNGQCVYNESHTAISMDAVLKNTH